MKYFTSLFLFCAVTLPQFVLAQDPAPDGLVTCKDGGNCNFCDFTEMVRIINIWLLVIVGLIAVILFMYAGYRITSSRGDVGIVTKNDIYSCLKQLVDLGIPSDWSERCWNLVDGNGVKRVSSFMGIIDEY